MPCVHWILRVTLLLPLLFLSTFTRSAHSEEQPVAQSTVLELTDTEKAWIKQHRVIHIQMADDCPPFEYRDNGVWQGMAHDYLLEACNRLGMEVEITGLNWTDALKGIQSVEKNVDLLLCVTYSKEREAQMLLTRPYLSFPQVIFMKDQHSFVANLKDLSNAKIAVERDYLMLGWLKRDLPEAKIKVMNNTPTCLQAVSSGQADAYVGNLAVATYLIDRKGLVNVGVAAPSDYADEEFSMGIRKDWPELVGILNKALDSIPPQESQEIRQKWMSLRFEYGVKPWDIIKWVLIVAGILLVFIVQLKRMVNRRTEELRAEVELRRTQERNLSEAQRIAHLGSWIRDLKRNSWSWSAEAHNIFGWPPGQALTEKDFEALVHAEDRARVCARYEGILKGGMPADIEYRIVRKDGETRHLLERAIVQLDAQGKPDKLEGIVLDITERVRMQEHMLQGQKVESIGQLAGGVAHDFNNLLTSIIGFSELAKLNLQDPVLLKQYLDFILQSANRGASLTQQLLAYARKKMIKPEDVDLNLILNRVEPLLQRLIGENIALSVKTGNQPVFVHVDAGSIEQVIVNLAINARDAMAQGGKLTLQTGTVTFTAENERADVPLGTYVKLDVTDTGEGMNPQTVARIFEPFFTTKPVGKGTGLGLAMCQGIIKQAHGHILVDSAEGRGTTMSLLLPRVEKVSEPKYEAANVGDARTGKETILVVEDDTLIRELASASLRMLGYDVYTAADGAQALMVAKSADRTIHLLVTDVVMPNMGGRELAEKLQNRNPRLLVLFTSGYAEDAIAREGVLNEGLHYLQKPYRPNVLAQTIRGILDQK